MTVTATPPGLRPAPADDIELMLERLEEGVDSVGRVLRPPSGPEAPPRAPTREERRLAATLVRSLKEHVPRLDAALVTRYRELERRGERDAVLEAQALRRDEVWHQLDQLGQAIDALTAEPAQETEPRMRHPRLAVAGTVLTILGALVVGFVLFELWVTDLYEERSQDALVADFRQALFVATAGDVDLDPNADFGEFQDVLAADPTGGTDGPEVVVYEPPARGSAAAVLSMPSIGVEKVVVEGTGSAELKEGPGRYHDGPLPGQPGNAIIVGHRVTYGAPFHDLDQLDPGDSIEAVTPQGIFTYRVVASEVVRPGDPDILEQGDENILTLVTSHPEYQADSRYVVRAELVGDPVRPSDDELEARRKGLTTPLTPDEDGLTADSTAWAWVLLWGELLVIAILVARRLYRRWLRWPTWLLTTPVVLALAFLLYESLDRLLPSTL